MIQQLKNRMPILIGLVIITNGLLHIFVAVLPIFRLAVPDLDEVGSILAVTSFRGMGMLIGIFLGFCLIILGRGICERKRKSWFIAVIVLLALCLNNYYTGALPKASIISGALLVALLLTFKL